MKLHYSQTGEQYGTEIQRVLVPYEITLLSNVWIFHNIAPNVLVPYEITLLSNTGTVLRKK